MANKPEPMQPIEAVPFLRLVRAALLLFLKDGMDYLNAVHCTGKQSAEQQQLFNAQKRAFNDLCRCGRITKRLAGLNLLEPAPISESFRRYVRRYYSEVQPEADEDH